MAPKDLHTELAAALPDLPRWVGPRGLLLMEPCEVFLGPEGKRGAGYLVMDREGTSAFAVHRPVASMLESLARQRQLPRQILVPLENAGAWRTLLPGWREQSAVLHVHPAPERLPPPRHPVRFLTLEDLDRLGHVEEDLLDVLSHALSRGPVAAAFSGELAVSFSHAAHQTETWFDLAIDTLPEFRRRGHGTSAASFLVHALLERGKKPVWGAFDADHASVAMARKYGFRAVERMITFLAPDPVGAPAS
jgi:GNAT superfamily N-acetyltransferase